MFDWKSRQEWSRLFRYYQAGLINMAFGFGLFALFVRIGLNVYMAQILSHILGVTFNYFTYSRYVFAGYDGKRLRFILTYVANYFFNLIALAVLMLFIKSPYLAGFITTVGVSAANYFVLKFLVYQERPA